jgi:hypothetical protein
MTESTIDLKTVIGSPAYRAVIVESCISARMSAVAQCVRSLKEESDGAWRRWSDVKYALEKDGKLDAATTFLAEVGEKLSESGDGLKALATWLAQAADEGTVIEQFLETNDGQLLAKAWNAVLTADVLTLATMTSYAENDITSNQNGSAVRKIFFDLLDQAGIKVISDGSSTRGFSGEQRGSLTFIIVEAGLAQQTGLKIARNRVFGYEDRPNGTTDSSAIVKGRLTTSPYNTFEAQGEPNTNAEAVKVLAEKIAAHLRAHYSKSE